MIQIKDYKAYIDDNKGILNLLKENNSILLSRLDDVTKVLDHICKLSRIKKDLNDDYEVIFTTGFDYIHENLESIKIYYEKYFNKDIILLKKYEKAINYILFLEDLIITISDKGKLDASKKNEINLIISSLDKKIQSFSLIDEDIYSDIDLKIETIVDDNVYYTTSYVFSLILEEMGL